MSHSIHIHCLILIARSFFYRIVTEYSELYTQLHSIFPTVKTSPKATTFHIIKSNNVVSGPADSQASWPFWWAWGWSQVATLDTWSTLPMLGWCGLRWRPCAADAGPLLSGRRVAPPPRHAPPTFCHSCIAGSGWPGSEAPHAKINHQTYTFS